MKRSTIIILSSIGLLAILFFVGLGKYVSIHDQNVDLKNEYKAQNGVIEANYDKMWKVMKDKAGITEKYAADFKSIYVPMIEGRYSKGDGSLMKWVTEHNPNFDTALYKDLMQSVESLRSEFESTQKRMLDIVREHDNLRQRFWSSIFIGDEKPLVYKVISSSKSQEVMRTGQDEYEPLFTK